MNRQNTVLAASIVIACCLPAGCAHKKQQPVTTGWENHYRSISALESWIAKGKVGIRAEGKSNSAFVYWEQKPDEYHITLSGPMNMGAVRIHGTATQVTVQTKKGTYVGKDPGELLYQTTGWHLPLSNLFYWIKGIPATGNPDQMTFSNDNNLTTLEEDSWRLAFKHYRQVGRLQLPHKLKLANHELQSTIVIHRWQLPGTPQPPETTH